MVRSRPNVALVLEQFVLDLQLSIRDTEHLQHLIGADHKDAALIIACELEERLTTLAAQLS